MTDPICIMKGCYNNSRHKDKFLCQKHWKSLRRTSCKQIKNVITLLNDLELEPNSQKGNLRENLMSELQSVLKRRGRWYA